MAQTLNASHTRLSGSKESLAKEASTGSKLAVRTPVSATLDYAPPIQQHRRNSVVHQLTKERNEMTPLTDIAEKFFDACDTGKGWDSCSTYCNADATFSAQASPLCRVRHSRNTRIG